MAHSATSAPLDLSRLDAALQRIDHQVTAGIEKGLPSWAVRPVEVASYGWHLLRDELPMPSLVLRRTALAHNIALMQAYCNSVGAWLAPHGKTTMAPKLFRDQLRNGAWAITVANIAQLQVCRAFGIDRVYVANEMVTAYDARYLARELAEHPRAQIYVAVDSAAGIEKLAQAMGDMAGARRLPVLVDFGMPGGRCGVRTLAEALAVARRVLAAAPYLELAGVHGYEGIAAGDTREDRLAAADRYLGHLQQVARELRPLSDATPFLVSSGGSQYFDRVVAHLNAEALPGCQLVLRSGGYVTHDSEFFDETSPFGRQTWRPIAGERLIPALEVWSTVLSLPEPGLAILGMGGRDMPNDIKLPVPLFHARSGGEAMRLDSTYRITRSNDQHAYMSYPNGVALAVGDVIGSGISHPCTAFDKWRSILVVDDDYRVVDSIRTYF